MNTARVYGPLLLVQIAYACWWTAFLVLDVSGGVWLASLGGWLLATGVARPSGLEVAVSKATAHMAAGRPSGGLQRPPRPRHPSDPRWRPSVDVRRPSGGLLAYRWVTVALGCVLAVALVLGLSIGHG